MIHANKQSYQRSDWANLTIVTEIDHKSFSWQGYLLHISMQRYPNGTVKPVSIGGLGYHGVGPVVQFRGVQHFTGTLDPTLPAGKYMVTSRLVQFIGVNVPITASNATILVNQTRGALMALLPQAISPSPSARVLIEANAEYYINSGTSGRMLLSPLISAVLTTLPLAAAGDDGFRRRRHISMLLVATLLLGMSTLPMVAADTP